MTDRAKYRLALLCAAALATMTAEAAETPLSDTSYGAVLEQAARERADPADATNAVAREMEARRRIFNGRTVAPGTYPSMAALGWVLDGRFVSKCGGSVIDPHWILTAAHCPLRSGDAIVLNMVSIVDVSQPTAFITDILRPLYDADKKHMDFAMIYVRTELPAPPIALATAPDYEITGGNPFIIAGWGRKSYGGLRSDDILLDARITTVPFKRCEQMYSVVPMSLTSSMFCGSADQSDACQGDSGGPAMQQTAPGKFVLVGVVSWGIDCGQRAFPGVYTRVSQIAGEVGKIIQRGAPPRSP